MGDSSPSASSPTNTPNGIDTTPGFVDPDTCQASPSPAAMRLLTAYEYDRTISDLFTEPLTLSDGLLEDGRRDAVAADGFFTNAAIDMDRTRLVQYRRAAEQLGELARDRARDLAACAESDDATCLDRFLRVFGRRVFRRPLSETEIVGLTAVYAMADATFEDGIALVASAMFQSIPFLYHVEKGNPASRVGDGVRLTPYELAERLSYFLLGTTPSDDLLDAAEVGDLDQPEKVRTWAEQLLSDPRARAHVARIHEEWLGIHDLSTVVKTSDLLDGTPDGLIVSMELESRSLIERVVFDGPGTLAELLLTDVSFVDENLSQLYEVAPVRGNSVDWGAQPRVGMLTRASWLMRHAGGEETLPTKRGKFVVNELLCENIQLPEDAVVPALAPPEDFRTTRERFESHSEMPCATACHSVMDPIGFAFENFDALGRYRTTENGYQVDTSGIVEVAGLTMDFENVTGLLEPLATSERASLCFASRMYEHAMGRSAVSQESCSISQIGQRFVDHGSIQALLVDIASSEAFRTKAVCE